METHICPTCGCSLVRLGIDKDKASTHSYNGKEYRFCCQGCVELFTTDPQKYLEEIKDLVVCQTCLGEKALKLTISQTIDDDEFPFCRCPHCLDEFNQNPEYYIKRLSGMVDYAGVFGKNSCCTVQDTVVE